VVLMFGSSGDWKSSEMLGCKTKWGIVVSTVIDTVISEPRPPSHVGATRGPPTIDWECEPARVKN